MLYDIKEFTFRPTQQFVLLIVAFWSLVLGLLEQEVIPKAKRGSCQTQSMESNLVPDGSREKCSYSPDMRLWRGLVLNPGTKKMREREKERKETELVASCLSEGLILAFWQVQLQS